MNRRNHAISVLQASQESPVFARLSELAHESSERLRSVQPLIPPALRASVRAGPVDGATWCLLLDNNAAAAKMRQLLPTIHAHLRARGCNVDSIRIKVQKSPA